jgi:putative heme-binding domain-containing protein
MRFAVLVFASIIAASDAHAQRVPWTGSRLTGTPEPPPPYRIERAFPRLKFVAPVSIALAPGSQRLFIEELRGKIFSLPDSGDVAEPDLFLDVGQIPRHGRTYGLAFHPDFAKNRLFYVCYVLDPESAKGTRVSRFRASGDDPPRADLASETILLEWPSGGHNGGCLQFGPDGYLYISTGDGSGPSPPDRHATGQDISDLLGSILRIDVDRPEPGKGYRVPADNPFVGQAQARPEIWAYGFRNPWKMSFDPKSGSLWVGDVGWEMWEMVYRVERGGNYGWSIVEGPQNVRTELPRGPTPILPPTRAHDHTESRSITGGLVYHGRALPELAGAYIYGDYVTGKLWGLRHDGTKVAWQQHLADSPLEIIDFGVDSRGELLILDHAGTLNRLVPNPAAQANHDFPRRLSQTGLFTSVKDQAPAPGVLRYAVNAEPWQDHAVAERFLAIPGLGTLGVYDTQNLQVGRLKGAWIYPSDTVFARTVSLDLERGNPATRRRLETQVLHQDRGTWRAYNYIWNDEQTDAALANPDGSDRELSVQDPDAPGGRMKQTWHHAGRTECLICHTTRAGSILGFNPAQLNRNHEGADQLTALTRLGLFEQPLPDPRPRLPDPFGSATLAERARGYLHVNCAHCHRRGGGGTSPFELLYELDLKRTLLVGTRPTQGTFEIAGAQNVAAGDPCRSILYYRMAKLGPGHMPQLGANLIDRRGLALVHDWISQLPAQDSTPTGSGERQAALDRLCGSADVAAAKRLLATPGNALYLLRALDTGRLQEAARQVVLGEAAKHTDSQVRDLFERFLPDEQRARRLGTSVQPSAILAMPGDAARGRQAFLKGAGVQCRNCHRVGSDGQELGPDLTKIAAKQSRAEILESILEPSKKVDATYVTYLAETSDGAVHSGLLVRKNTEQVVLKDAQAKLIAIPAGDVATLVPQAKSLMPDLLLRDMRPQDVADLLEFLTTLR